MKSYVLRTLTIITCVIGYQVLMAQEASILTKELMWAYCVRVNHLDITDEIIIDYIQNKDEELSKEIIDNKFKFHKEKEKYRSELQALADNFDFSKRYKIILRAYFSEYDFEKEGYNTRYDTLNSSYYSNDKFLKWHFLKVSNDHNLYVNNDNKQWFFLPLSPDTAEAREMTLKDNDNNNMLYINEIFAAVIVKLSESPISSKPKDNSHKGSKKEIAESIMNKWEEDEKKELLPYTLHGNIIAISLFDDDSTCQANLIGTIQ